MTLRVNRVRVCMGESKGYRGAKGANCAKRTAPWGDGADHRSELRRSRTERQALQATASLSRALPPAGQLAAARPGALPGPPPSTPGLLPPPPAGRPPATQPACRLNRARTAQTQPVVPLG